MRAASAVDIHLDVFGQVPGVLQAAVACMAVRDEPCNLQTYTHIALNICFYKSHRFCHRWWGEKISCLL